MPQKEIGHYQPRAVVRFKSYVHLPYDNTAADELDKQGLASWKELTQRFPGITLGPLFTGVQPDEIAKLMARARAADPTYQETNLLSYFVVKMPTEVDSAGLVETVSKWEIVDKTYVEPPPTDPPVDASDDPCSPDQGYLNPAPSGVDARYAWNFPGGDGAGQALVDLERGWTLDHQDLICHGITCIFGLNYDFEFHGTRALGTVTACDNKVGCVGIAPSLTSVRCVSQWLTGGGYSTSDPILAAINNMSAGDVLLLEAQTEGELPVEYEQAVFDVIRLATALGIVVVECAGNGFTDLDTVVVDGKNIFDRLVRDSGAIIVGSARFDTRARIGSSCFGSRVDCFAWGHHVEAPDSDSSRVTTLYTGIFAGTSSAGAIVAGAALSVQGLAQAHLGHRLTPPNLRNILSDPLMGTHSASPAADRIGVMPNLRAIIESDVLNIAPDVYLRDFVDDTGDPHTVPVSNSPDLIVRTEPVADSQAAFGEGSGTEISFMDDFSAEAGHDNFVYVRARNRGGSVAEGVKASVYWSPATTLVTPDLWHFVGSVTMPDIPTGNILTVSNAILWPADSMPPLGSYHLIGLIGHKLDPAPSPADFRDWDGFRRFVQANNNVTFRNLNVVDFTPIDKEAPADFVPLEFFMVGTPDRVRPMQLEIVGRLPKGTVVVLEMPSRLASRLAIRPLRTDPNGDTVFVAINAFGRTRFGDIDVPARARIGMRLLVQIPKHVRNYHFNIFARQLFQNEEVGRAAWRLGPRRMTGYAKEASAH